ncbi:MAG: VWA domain-containing protein [Planctomycetes bacterium]|nr:VWA domain-containing protein [Planctomycetota bacterium]
MRRMLVTLAMVLALGGSAQATGMLIPVEKKLPPLALVDQKVTINIEDQVAVTRIEQSFRNHTGRELEATYLFPVPKGASVRKFTMWVNGVEVPGEIVKAEEARKIYTDIVSRSHDPGLLEYMNQSLMKVRVFPVPPKGDQRISISYTSVSNSDNGLVEYMYPMRTDGKAAETLEKFSISINLKDQRPLTNIYSPSHPITITRPNDKEAVIGFEKNAAILDRDFQLFYQAGNKDIGLTAVTHRPISDRPGYFMMLLSPRAELSKMQVQPRDFVYVIDTSGSMRGKRLTQAKNALKYCLKQLNEGDRFALINFASTVTKYANNLQTATTSNLEAARKWVDDLEATGGTNIDEALRDALAIRSSDTSRTYTMIFFTDGQPTWGERNPQKILENVKRNNTGSTRIFSFGVGDDVNTVLLDGLADTTKAVSSYVREAEDIEAKVSSLYAKISNPVLANLKLEVGGDIAINEMYPQQLPDLFHGSQLVIFGRYTGKGHAGIRLVGQIGKETKTFDYELNFTDKTTGNQGFVEDLWARRKVGHLLDQIRLQGETKEVVEEVVTLAKRYGITTPYTSYLLVPDAPPPGPVGGGGGGGNRPFAKGKKGGPSDAPPALLPGPGGFGSTTKPTSPIPLADLAKQLDPKIDINTARGQLEDSRLKNDAEKGDAKDKKAAKETLEQQSALQKAQAAFNSRRLGEVQNGKLGVDFAVQNNALRFEQQLRNTASRFVQNRNVVDVGGVWIDDGFNAKMDMVTVKAQSEAYFDILKLHPEVKDVYALGNYVIWVTPSGKALIIDRNSGRETMPAAEIEGLFKAAPKKTDKK